MPGQQLRPYAGKTAQKSSFQSLTFKTQSATKLTDMGFVHVSQFGLAVRHWAGKREDLGSVPLRLSFLFKKVVVCGHCLVTLSITFY